MTGLVDTGCAVVSTAPFALAMQALGALGDGLHDAGIAALLLVLGSLARHERTQRVGLTALLAVFVAGLLAVLLKPIFQAPRPDAGAGTFAFPSGHATTAFALVGVLGHAFPAWSPLAFLLAVLAGLARVYHRVHFLRDVAAGALLGTVTGVLLARARLGPVARRPGRRRLTWTLAALGALPLLVFFVAYERALATYRTPEAAVDPGAGVVLRFGTEEARPYLGRGWSGPERWTGGFPMTWVEGREAELTLPAAPAGDQRLRLRLHPFVGGDGPACQTVSVSVNGAPVATMWLDTGWRWYEVPVGAAILTERPGTVHFRFARAARPSDHGAPGDARLLSVAFAVLQLVPAGSGR